MGKPNSCSSYLYDDVGATRTYEFFGMVGEQPHDKTKNSRFGKCPLKETDHDGTSRSDKDDEA